MWGPLREVAMSELQARAQVGGMSPEDVVREQLLELRKIRSYTKATAALLGLMLVVGFIVAVVALVLVTGAGSAGL